MKEMCIYSTCPNRCRIIIIIIIVSFCVFLMTFAHLCLYSRPHTTFIIYDSVMLLSSPLYDQWFGVECDIYDMTMRQELRVFC